MGIKSTASRLPLRGRYNVENALAARAHGATVLTYARVERVLSEGGAVEGVEFTDLLGGGRHQARAPLVVNVAGPWVDEILAHADGGGFGPLVGGTKGSHVVVEKFPGAPEDALYVEAEEDARPFFIIPWDGKYLIGTTDTVYGGDLDRVEADGREVAYLIGETNRVIPRAALARESVLYTYAGVRPLPVVRAPSEAAVTRRHFVRDHAPDLRGLFSVVGGKLTTYRNLSRQVVDSLFRALGRPAPPCATARVKLPGAAVADFDAFREAFKAEGGLPAATAERLLKVYGARAAEVLAVAGDAPDLREPFSPVTPTLGAEVVFAFESELAETLADCLLRRTMVGLNSRAGLDAVEAAALVARKYLGWDDARARREVAAYREYVRRFHPRELD
jgi:glycerol-3-phosphate dehydrogenase